MKYIYKPALLFFLGSLNFMPIVAKGSPKSIIELPQKKINKNESKVSMQQKYINFFITRYNANLVAYVPKEKIYEFDYAKYLNSEYKALQKIKNSSPISNLNNLEEGYYLVFDKSDNIEYLLRYTPKKSMIFAEYIYEENGSIKIIKRYLDFYDAPIISKTIINELNYKNYYERIDFKKAPEWQSYGNTIYFDNYSDKNIMIYRTKNRDIARLIFKNNKIFNIHIYDIEALKYSEGLSGVIPQYFPQIYEIMEYYKSSCILNDMNLEIDLAMFIFMHDDIYPQLYYPGKITTFVNNQKDLEIELNYLNDRKFDKLLIKRNNNYISGGPDNSGDSVYVYQKGSNKLFHKIKYYNSNDGFKEGVKKYYFDKVFKYFFDHECTFSKKE